MHAPASRWLWTFLACALWNGAPLPASAATTSFQVKLNGAQQVPPVVTNGSGTADLTYDPATKVLAWNVVFSGLSGPAVMAHFHGPAPADKNAGVLIWMSPKGKMESGAEPDRRPGHSERCRGCGPDGR